MPDDHNQRASGDAVDPRLIVKLLKIDQAHRRQSQEALQQLSEKAARAVARALPGANADALGSRERPALTAAGRLAQSLPLARRRELLDRLPPEVADELADEIFSFETLPSLPPRAAEQVLRTVSPRVLATALVGVSEEFYGFVANHVSRRAKAMLDEEVESVTASGSLTKRDVSAARRDVASSIRGVAYESHSHD
jgi:flagellar motor switch protein FliG